MANYIIKDTTLQGIANAIRAKTGETGSIPTLEMADKISSISTGVELPSLENEGAAIDLVQGKEMINSQGEKVIGTNPYEKIITDETVEDQAGLIAEIKDKVNNLPNNTHDIFLLREATSYTNNSATKIGRGAFYDWVSLVLVNCPNVTSIGANAFNACTALKEIIFPSVTYINNNAFRQCSALESIYLPEATTIQSSFSLCTKLKSVTLPKIEAIDNGTFYGCTSLETIEFPTSFTRILRQNCFYNCSALTKLVLPYAGVVSLASANNLTGTPFASGQGHIYVHPNYVNSYKTATNWSQFASVITSMEEMDDE